MSTVALLAEIFRTYRADAQKEGKADHERIEIPLDVDQLEVVDDVFGWFVNEQKELRAKFAAKALQGLLASHGDSDRSFAAMADSAVRYADALLVELDNTRADRLQTLILAARPALEALESELYDRKSSGNDEDFAELEQLVTNLREALP